MQASPRFEPGEFRSSARFTSLTDDESRAESQTNLIPATRSCKREICTVYICALTYLARGIYFAKPVLSLFLREKVELNEDTEISVI